MNNLALKFGGIATMILMAKNLPDPDIPTRAGATLRKAMRALEGIELSKEAWRALVELDVVLQCGN